LRQFSGLDSAFLFMDSHHAPMHGAFLQTYAPVKGVGPKKRFERIVRLVESRIHTSPMLCRKVLRFPMNLDHPLWVEDENIDLEFHIRRVTLPKPGNFKQLCGMYAEINAQPLDLNRPLWEIHLIDGINAVAWAPKRSFALVVKFHHAGADGITATEITSALHDDMPMHRRFGKPVRRKISSPEDSSPDGFSGIAGGLYRTSAAYVNLTYQMAKFLPDAGISLGKKVLGLAQASSGEKAEKSSMVVPRSMFNGPISDARSYTNMQISLDAIKAMRAGCKGATFNDVYLTICGGALYRFMDHYGRSTPSSLIAACPVNVRLEAEAGKAGNQFSVMRIPLHSNEKDPLARLSAIVASTAESKKTEKSSGNLRQIADLAKSLPGPLIAGLGSILGSTHLMAKVQPLANMIITNVPGPRARLYLDGAELLDINGCPPIMNGLGIIMGASSYCDHMTITAWACKKMMPDAEVMHACMRAAFAELRDAAVNNSARIH